MSDFVSFSDKIKFLKSHISSNLWLCAHVVNADGSDGMRYFRPSKKGNDTYSFLRRKRFRAIGLDLRSSFKLSQLNESKIDTNTLFITLTKQYDRTNLTEEAIEDSWKFFNAQLPNFMRNLKKSLKITKYACVLEAHESGCCHAHIVIQTQSPYKCIMSGLKTQKKTRKTRKTWRNDYISNLVQHLAEGLGFGRTDCQGCDNVKAISSYISKELCKQGKSIEQAIKDYYARTGLESEQIKVLKTHFYSISLHMRLLRTSRGLGKDYIDWEESDAKSIAGALCAGGEPEAPCYYMNISIDSASESQKFSQYTVISVFFYRQNKANADITPEENQMLLEKARYQRKIAGKVSVNQMMTIA